MTEIPPPANGVPFLLAPLLAWLPCPLAGLRPVFYPAGERFAPLVCVMKEFCRCVRAGQPRPDLN